MLFVVLSVGIVGCSKHVGLSGKVVYSDTGEPVPFGEVQLWTPTFVAKAPIRSDGTFTVGSYQLGDGVPPGTYHVGVAAYDEEGDPLIHPKHASPERSGLTITIETTTRNFEIKVDRAPPIQHPGRVRP